MLGGGGLPAASAQVELVPWLMPDLERMLFRFRERTTFCPLDLPQAY